MAALAAGNARWATVDWAGRLGLVASLGEDAEPSFLGNGLAGTERARLNGVGAPELLNPLAFDDSLNTSTPLTSS